MGGNHPKRRRDKKMQRDPGMQRTLRGGEVPLLLHPSPPSPSFPPAPASHPRAHPLERWRLGLVAESEIGLRFSERTFCGAAERRCQKGPVITGPKTRQSCFRGAPSHTASWHPPPTAKWLPRGRGQTERPPALPGCLHLALAHGMLQLGTSTATLRSQIRSKI